MRNLLLTWIFLAGVAAVNAQTMYVPSGTGGIGSSSNSYVGVGTGSPGALLQVTGATARETFRVLLNSSSTNYLNIWQGTGAGAIDPIGTGKLYLGYDLPTEVYIGGNNAGKLGIGTTAPANALSVQGRLGIRYGADPSAASEPLRVEGGITAEENVVNVTNLADQDFVVRLSQAGASVKRTFIGPSTATRFSLGVGTGNEQLTIINGGNVGIGTTAPDEKLAVKGKIHAQEVRVDMNGAVAPDYVFEKEYHLPSLETIKAYINRYHHLPEIPSAEEMESNGIKVGEMNLLLLKKIEELTLYMIELKEENKAQQDQINRLTRK